MCHTDNCWIQIFARDELEAYLQLEWVIGIKIFNRELGYVFLKLKLANHVQLKLQLLPSVALVHKSNIMKGIICGHFTNLL